MREVPCPICGKPAARRPGNPHFPFCSRRCRMVDLGKWLGEEYRVPGKPEESEGEPVPEDREPDA